MLDIYHPLIADADLAEGGSYTTVINGWHILLVKIDGACHAVNDRCTHAASPLSTGRIRRGTAMCPLHGARFDLKTGQCIGGAHPALRQFQVRVELGMISVALPVAAPGMSDLPVSFG